MTLIQQNMKGKVSSKKTQINKSKSCQNISFLTFSMQLTYTLREGSGRRRRGRRRRGWILIGWWVKCWWWYRLLVCCVAGKKRESLVFANDPHDTFPSEKYVRSCFSGVRNYVSPLTYIYMTWLCWILLNISCLCFVKCLTNDYTQENSFFPQAFWRKKIGRAFLFMSCEL